jgi:hypothetical protein
MHLDQFKVHRSEFRFLKNPLDPFALTSRIACRPAVS